MRRCLHAALVIIIVLVCSFDDGRACSRIDALTNFGCRDQLQPAFLLTHRIRRRRRRRSLSSLQCSNGDLLRTLYPASAPNRNGTLQVDATHRLFYREHGRSDPSSLTALFLHGGPGAGCSPDHARFFDPEVYRVVLLDQRGSGRSEPRGEAFVNNTLLHLVRDCEALRIGLGIGRWDVVLGGSWGSTLAVAYAQEHPRSVRSLLLRGVCLLRQSEVDWLTSRRGGAASAVDPEGWAEFSSAVGVNASNDCTGRDALHAYYDRLLGSNQPPEVRLLAARSWMRWEMRVSAVAREHTDQKRNETGHSSSSAEVLVWNQRYGWGYCNHSGTQIVSKTSAYRAMEEIQQMRRGIHPKDAQPRDQQLVEPRPLRPVRDEVTLADLNASAWSRRQNQSADEVAGHIPAQTMLTCFYSVNRRYAMNGVDLLSPERMARIRNTRCIAVQGAMDAICPPDTALDLHIAWPEMELRIPRFSGHSMYDRGITHELVRATERLASELLEARSERRH